MSGNLSNNLKLNLDKDKYIFIEPTLQQHHIDGLRFIYKQYHRKKPGIIVNNPEKYDSILQIALFLSGILNTQEKLAKAVLILCEEDNLQQWTEHFEKLLNSHNDTVVVAATNPFMKKTVFINTSEGIFSFTRRTWSVLVVGDDYMLKDKVLLNKFDADYKIWLTPNDVKENLKTLAVIHKWIYPKEKFDIDYFQDKTGHFRDTISKAILLETFLEDIVYKPLNKPSPIKISLKNKDATGTKIKRSKRPLDSVSVTKNGDSTGTSVLKIPKNKDSNVSADNFIPSSVNNSNAGILLSGVHEYNSKDNTQSDDDIESFIQSKKPIEGDYLSDCVMEDREKAKHKKSNIILSDSDDSAYDLETQEFLKDDKETMNSNASKSNEFHGDVSNATDLTNTEHLEVTLPIHMDIDDEIVKVIPKEKNSSVQQTNSKEIRLSSEEVTEISEKNNSPERVNFTNVEMDENIKTEESRAIRNENKRVDLDSKITEHEDRIFKKFKGTFLDSIF